jgi:hypothetical protein
LLFCLQVDLAVITGLLILYYSLFLTIRELTGPFTNELMVKVIMSIYQSLYFTVLSCTLSLQLIQVFSIFFAPNFNDWSDDLIVGTHRVFVASTGFFIGTFICYLGGGMCRPSPLNLYFLQETNVITVFKQSKFSVIVMAIFVLVIIGCQISLEVKRYLIDKIEMKADFIARSARRNINVAILELGVENLPPQVRLAWQEHSVVNVNTNHHYIHRTFQQNPNRIFGQNQQDQHSERIKSESEYDNLDEENYLRNISRDQAVRIARYISIFGILPTLLTIISLSLENINGLRPHAATAFVLITYGVAIPFTLIISSNKLRRFTKAMILNLLNIE